MTAATLDQLLDQCSDYKPDMMHSVPVTTAVERADFVVERCRAKRVISFGATGPMQSAVNAVASESFGVDIETNSAIAGDRFRTCDLNDLDRHATLPFSDRQFDVALIGELIEHLSNPGRFLDCLRRSKWEEMILTTPNAFSKIGMSWIVRGTENVNVEHVAWYSWRTLTTLLERHKYTVRQWHWYNGQPLTAEGLIFICVR